MKRLWIKRLWRALATAPIVTVVTVVAYGCHAKAFVAGFLYLLPIMLIAFGWGIFEASVASVLAVGCLDYFFTEPLFHFYMSDPQDWVALTSFEAIVLIVSRFAERLKHHATETNDQRERIEKLYLMSRDILLMDRRKEIGAQLVNLIVDLFQLDGIALWDAREAQLSTAGNHEISADEVRATYLHEYYENDFAHGVFKRVLMIGTRPIGALCLASAAGDGRVDSRSVDAIASLSAIALERAHSFMAESSAEAAKWSEQLRSTVLDGLAHAFKTPLATIQTASSGLLEISSLERAQQELVSLINQEAIHLANLTTQVLQTAKLDEKQLKVDYQEVILEPFLDLCREENRLDLAEHALNVSVGNLAGRHIWADARLLQMALAQLLDNASKYASVSSPITLRVVATDAETVFSVHNEGSYIAPAERPRVFKRFYRSPGSEYRAPGTGIGLSVAKRIAEAHRGRVWIESDPETGTTFFLTLPHLCKEA
jgi:two-component system, OmpR family, sensor histidine kinase KdpD